MTFSIYTMQEIDGIVEVGPKPETSNAARIALIDLAEQLRKSGWIEQHTLADGREFKFPFEKPNPAALRDFFGGEKDLNIVQAEIDELERQWRAELKAAKDILQDEIANAKTIEDFDKILEKYHYDSPANKQTSDRHSYNCDRNRLHRELTHERAEAVKILESNHSNWCRSHVAHLYNCCGDAMFYGAGCWMMRAIPASAEAKDLIERFFTSARLPYQTIDLAALRKDVQKKMQQ